MEDTEARAVFARLLEAEPPAPEIAPYVSRARRDTARRQWRFAGAGVATMAVLVAGTLAVSSVLLAGSESGAGSGAGSSAGAKARVTTANLTETPTVKAARLTVALKGTMRLQASVKVTKASTARPPLTFYPDEGGYLARARISDRAGTGEVRIYVANSKSMAGVDPATRLRNACQEADRAVTTCELTRRSNGDLLATLRTTKPSGQVEWKVMVARSDGTWVTAGSINYEQQDASASLKVRRPTPPITMTELMAIVLEPRLSFHPTQPVRPLAQPKAPGARLPNRVPVAPVTTETSAKATARLDLALTQALPLPAGARLVADRSSTRGALRFYPSQGGFQAKADIVDSLGTGHLFVRVSNANGTSLLDDICLQPPVSGKACRSFRTHAGDLVIVQRELRANGVITLRVQALRVDGTNLVVDSWNYGANSIAAGDQSDGGNPQRASLTLTEEQLIGLALNAKVSYHP